VDRGDSPNPLPPDGGLRESERAPFSGAGGEQGRTPARSRRLSISLDFPWFFEVFWVSSRDL
jgi:hypothetical protein